MDSVTQALLGAAVAAAIVPARHRRAALLAGAALGTLPDLDSIPIALFTDDPVALMTLHRGASHSLLVLPLLGTLLWWLCLRLGGRVAESPRRWFWAIQAALLTHPLLDAMTVYGTQLLWPLPLPPVMWSSVFIIDPLFTVWLLLGVAVAAFAGSRPAAGRALALGLALGGAYLGWSLLAKDMVEREAQRSLAAMGLQDAPRFSVPTPFNTLLWRVVAMTPSGYVEGFRSIAADEGAMAFREYPSDVDALSEAAAIPAVARLSWFNRGFMRVRRDGDELVLSDLRMGMEPDYFFSFAVARHGSAWKEIAPRRIPVQRDFDGVWEATWRRMWRQPGGGDAGGGLTVPPQAAAGSTGASPAASASK